MPNYGGTFTNLAKREISLGVPVGTVFAWPCPVGATVPTGYLLCDGDAVLRTTYPELFAILGTMFGDGTTKASGGGSVSSGFGAGTAFNLPDIRGRFIRGADHMGTSPGAAQRDTTGRAAQSTGGSSSYAGSVQGDTMGGHGHEAWSGGNQYGNTGTVLGHFGGTNWGSLFRAIFANNIDGAPRVTSETRPLNITCQFIMRAF